jgi:hypothetical protein
VEASNKATTLEQSTLSFLPLAKWDEYNSYGEVVPSRLRYTIEWKMATNNKVVCKDTKQDVVLAPAVYWRLYLQPKVEKLVAKKASQGRQVELNNTSVVASVNNRSERDLCKQYNNMHVN